LHIRADKFYPPQVDTPQFLFRERIVDELTRRCGSRKPTIILEARAGQGKSTLIKQFLNRLDIASIWFQVGPEDADPAFFLVAIQACIADLLPECSPAAGMRPLTGGAIALFDLPKRIDLLLDDIKSCLKNDLYMVFDDLHNLIPHESSRFILNYLVENAPPKLHFILSSREPMPLGVWQSFPGSRNLIRIGNRELALNEDEVADFFHRIFHMPTSHDAILEISANTDGWVMGIVLLGLQLMQGRGMSPAVGWDGMGRPDILEYFRLKIFDPLEPRLHEPLLVLSLLEEIPVALARALTMEPDIGIDLDRLAGRNIFIRRLDADATVYALHHLFRQFLREKAKDELAPETIQRIYRQAGQFFFQSDNPSQALRYLLKARDYGAIETVLQASGTAMLAANQTATLAAILGQIPEPDLARLGWTCFYLALAHLDFAPAQALPLLMKALEVFSARRDEHGELLCLAHIISIHITTTGHYREGEERLARAEELYSRIAETLDAATTILLARSLAMGRCIFLADTDAATRYANLALNLARQEKLVNFEAALLMVMGYIRIFAGRLALARLWMEQAAVAAHRPEVGTFNCLAIRMMLFNFLFHDGDFANYFDQKNQLVAAIGNAMVSQSIAGPFCYIWEMDIAINQGRFEEALTLAAQALALDPPLSPHLHSQILQLQAVVLALHRQAGPALEAAAESTRLREQAGGLYFVTLNKLLVGLAHGLCGRYDQAVALLAEGIDGARNMPTAYLEACGLLHRGWVHLDHGDHEQAREDIEAGLSLMRRNAYRHFWAWTPRAIQAVLGFAVAQGIETDYARALAAERIDAALEDDGAAIPHLEFRTLGGFTILYRGAPLLDAEALTPAQRELLCLLLASPGLKMAQETAHLHFWPDSPSAAAKAKFDTLVSRLRKTLAEVLPENAAHCHLNRDKGIIRLIHCRVDALDFQRAVKRGLEHSRSQEFWQAANAFARADALWQGEFAPGITGEDQIRAFRDALVKALTQMTLAWCAQLPGTNRSQAAIELTEKALRADPLNDVLWALLYRLHGRSSAIQARLVLTRFAERLKTEDFPKDEIAALTQGIASAPEPSFSPKYKREQKIS
jgi:ATP/maltotriose-dependent transcriptional regulator MalT/DNA-binding SARP family transcriptional activator